ncbi:MAG: hypothetical protein ISQ14_09230 [Verrucomicrobiae bacterium]|jgi:hypothetical protein|nr:hypothetical protein [Verrucomicrobiae bacterium]
MNPLLSVHAAATWALVGLIWTVQLVHYPLFAQVGADTFRAYHARHARQISWIVGPLMAVELGTAALLLVLGARELWLLGSLVPLAFNWLATWRVQIPLHGQLSAGFDAGAHRRLVSSNWWRTAAWSIRGACVLFGFW